MTGGVAGNARAWRRTVVAMLPASTVLVTAVLAVTGCGVARSADGPKPAGARAAVGAGTAVSSKPTIAGTAARECSPARSLPAGTTRHQLVVAGSRRSYLLHIPPGYTGTRELPVVVTLHGYGQSAEEQLALSDFPALADRDGFLVVAPESLGPGWDFSPPSSDYTFIATLMAVLPSVVCVDPHRLYATGISEGAAVVFSLACANIGGFAAYGAVAGAFYWPQCHAAPPQPIVYFHGTADPLVPINGGPIAGGTVAPARQSMAAWAAHNGCQSGPRQSAVSSDVTFFTWTGCQQNADVNYYVIAGGGHSWPGAPPTVAQAAGPQLGRTTETVSASQIMWDFFASRHR